MLQKEFHKSSGTISNISSTVLYIAILNNVLTKKKKTPWQSGRTGHASSEILDEGSNLVKRGDVRGEFQDAQK